MSGAWIEVEEGGAARRVPLGPAGLEIGPPESDVPLASAPRGRLSIALDPPSVRHEGPEEGPRRLERALERGPLAEGDVLSWQDARIAVYGLESEPRAAARAAPRAPRASAGSGALVRIGRRIAAGIAVEIGLAPGQAARDVQAEAARGSFDADGAAERLLEGVPLDDPRLAARAAALERDLVMVPLQRGSRGAMRRARRGVRTGVAGLLAQGLALLAMSALLLAVLVLGRARWDFSVDLWLDRILGRG